MTNDNGISPRPATQGTGTSTFDQALLAFLTLPSRAVEQLLVWDQRSRERRQLAELSSRALDDIGLDRSAMDREAAKPFWVD